MKQQEQQLMQLKKDGKITIYNPKKKKKRGECESIHKSILYLLHK